MDPIRQIAVSAILVLGSQAADAFNCTPTEGEVCVFDLNPVSVVFGSGQYSFDGDSQFQGNDGYVTGYTVGTHAFPDLSPLNPANGQHGFSFTPSMEGAVGGSGFVGDHEAFASFRFDEVHFAVAPGWRLDSLTYTVSGERRIVGAASVAMGLPGTAVFDGNRFVASGSLPLDATGFGAYFSAYTSYEEGEDGAAGTYGTAFVRFDRVSVVAHVSAVPEPATWGLWACGLAGLAWRQRSHLSRND